MRLSKATQEYLNQFDDDDLIPITCATCCIKFGVTKDFYRRRRTDGKNFQCPNNHSNIWTISDDASDDPEEVIELKDKVAKLLAKNDQLEAKILELESKKGFFKKK